nr:MAG TPA: hypothetical protein [Caudoviricetes sp.]
MPDNAVISKITLPSGSTYDIKDAAARANIKSAQNDIDSIKTSIAGGMSFIGVTTTKLYDGATTNPIAISGNDSYVPMKGNVVMYGELEFIWSETDSKWHEFGSTGSLKALAFKDKVSTPYTPIGSVSKPTFTGTKATITHKMTPAGTVAISKGTVATDTPANYTPEGTLSQPTFTGTAFNSTGKFTPTGSVTISKGTGTANYTPEGTVTSEFVGTEGDVTVKGTPTGTVTISKGTGTANYTPAGSVSQPTFTGTAFTSTGKFTPAGTNSTPTFTGTEGDVTVKGTPTVKSASISTGTVATSTPANYTPGGTISAPTITVTPKTEEISYYSGWTGSVANENLTISFETTTKTVVTGITSATASKPTFTGTAARLNATVTMNELTSTGTFTPEGTVSAPTFTGTQGTVTVSGTPKGTVSKPTFTGTGARLNGTFTGTEGTASVDYTPAGTISTPTFTGTAATITMDGTK